MPYCKCCAINLADLGSKCIVCATIEFATEEWEE